MEELAGHDAPEPAADLDRRGAELDDGIVIELGPEGEERVEDLKVARGISREDGVMP